MTQYYQDTDFKPRLIVGADPNGEYQFATAIDPEKEWHNTPINDITGSPTMNPTSMASKGTSLHMLSTFGGDIFTSTDGITWTELASAPFGILPSDGAYKIIYDSINTKWVAVGVNAHTGAIFTSIDDGVTWVTQTHSFVSEAVTDVIYANSLYIAVGSNGKIQTSTDATTWSDATSPFGTSTINAIAASSSLFMAVGEDSKIATSPDGITWTLVNNSLKVNLTDIIFDGTNFIMTGESGVAAISSGTTVSKKDSKISKRHDIYAITQYGSKIIIVGEGGFISMSIDHGVKWTPLDTPWVSSQTKLLMIETIPQQ